MITLVNNTDKKVIVAYRGTKLSHFSDLIHDAAILVNYVAAGSILADKFNLPNRFNSALNFTQE
jgi:UDP-N-acetylglucosamine transferase subunit ALG13